MGSSITHSYTGFGLQIRSDFPLPELRTARTRTADVAVRLGVVDQVASVELREDGVFYSLSPNEAYFRWPGVGAFRVSQGREVIVQPEPGVDWRTLRLPVLGAVLSTLLHQRGFLVLHAGAVAIDGRAIVFAGEKGRGKSTMVAALYQRGHTLLADDTVAIDLSPRQPVVLPGFPQIKLFPESVVAALGEDPDTLPYLAPSINKHQRIAFERFADGAVPLAGICTLAASPEVTLKRLAPHEAVVQLLSQTYVARYGAQALQGESAAAHLRACVDLLKRTPMYSLQRPIALERVTAVAQYVEAQFCPSIVGQIA